MRRLFYFTGYRMMVFHWRGKRLDTVVAFEPNEADFARFVEYLRRSARTPVRLLADVIEEDFRIEVVPHVGGKDRKAVVSRLLDRYYRSSKAYCHYEVIGRESGGRRDDRVLIGAITNPSLIEPWIDLIVEADVPLSGIWSLPLVSAAVLKKIDAHQGVSLLISQQVKSNVRQSLFRDGKLLSSRQSIINQEIVESGQMGRHVVMEVERTVIFLRNQGLLANDEVIHLHIIANERQKEIYRTAFESNERQHVEIHLISDLLGKMKLENVDPSLSTGVFSWLCLQQGKGKGHYGEPRLFQRYRNAIVASLLYIVSLLVLVTGFLVTESTISTAMGNKASSRILRQEEDRYRSLYNREFSKYERFFGDAEVMRSAVELEAAIGHNRRTSPLGLMLRLGKVLADERLPDFEVRRIEWRAVNRDETGKALLAENRSADFTAANGVWHYARITGRIKASEKDYRESVKQIETITHRLERDERIENVEVISMPVDLRPQSKFSAESGVKVTGQASGPLSGRFILQFLMKEGDDG